jgi:3-ketosteroid 9alpha-monooxygenase subunit A
MLAHGWYQVAFERDLTDPLTTVTVGKRQFVMARFPDGLRMLDAFCPHRGAHLGIGGRLEKNSIVCPFHGYRIGIDGAAEHGFTTCSYETLVIGGCVFVRLSNKEENGFRQTMTRLDTSHYFVPGFTMTIRAPAAMVIENGFDEAHFRPVHGIAADRRFELSPGECGELRVRGVFGMPVEHSPSQHDVPSQVRFSARAFSPGVFLAELQDSRPYSVLTASTPTPDDACVVRVSLVMPSENGAAPAPTRCEYLLRQSRAGLEKDRLMWENMSYGAPTRYTARDGAVIGFRRFCERFIETQPEVSACAPLTVSR